MKIIKQSHKILTPINELKEITKRIESAARTCYKSEDRIKEGSDIDLCRKLISRGHEAMLEHCSISVRFITDRGVTHELVRHRVASFAQESTRYVKYDGDTEFVLPVFRWNKIDFELWESAMKSAEKTYKNMISHGLSPQEARSVLPNSLKTEIVVTANIREWRHIFKLRTDKSAHPQIREMMISLLQEFKKIIPVLFDDVLEEEDHQCLPTNP